MILLVGGYRDDLPNKDNSCWKEIVAILAFSTGTLAQADWMFSDGCVQGTEATVSGTLLEEP